MIPVFVINLARSPDRRAWMERELEKAGVAARFVRAVDGRRFGASCEAWPSGRAGTRLSKFEAALALSHRKVWRTFLAGASDHAVVLEDDVRLGRGFDAALQLDWSRWAFDVVKFETMFDRVWLSRRGVSAGARRLHRLGAEHHGAAAYLISREGALKMLSATRGLDEPIDVSLFGRRAISGGFVRALQLVPALAVQQHLRAGAGETALPSTLAVARGEVGAEARRVKRSGWARLRREASRLAEQGLRWIRLAPTMSRRKVPYE